MTRQVPPSGRLWGVALGVLLAAGLLQPDASRAAISLGPVAQSEATEVRAGRCASDHYSGCRRLRYSAPVHVTPGANYQLIAPSIAKPVEDGYLVRLQANLVRADGSVPPVDIIHLHHAVWINNGPGSPLVPFYGVGEEKTPTIVPDGFGWRLHPADSWLVNFMIHNLTASPETVNVVWEIDFVPRESAERQGIAPVEPLALEVRRDDHPLYPVFNVQRPYGTFNPKTGLRECTYPRDDCAAFDPYGRPQPGNGVGYDYTVPRRQAGTIVFLIGHLHPGGLRDELSIVRTVNGRSVERPLFTFEAKYYGRRRPVSWDFGMTVTPPEWRVEIRPGDRLRLNAVYEAQHANWYEGMGLVYGWVAPGDATGVNPFRRVRSRSGDEAGRYIRFPRRGPLTHGHLPENDNQGGDQAWALPDKAGPLVNDIGISAFSFSDGDLSRVRQSGIPRVRADDSVTFRNYDSIAGIWHTITTCKQPCTGRTGVAYPIADGRPALDSLELGWTPPPFDTSQASGQRYQFTIRPDRDGLDPGSTYTYFCRVHPFMRGALKVVEPPRR